MAGSSFKSLTGAVSLGPGPTPTSGEGSESLISASQALEEAFENVVEDDDDILIHAYGSFSSTTSRSGSKISLGPIPGALGASAGAMDPQQPSTASSIPSVACEWRHANPSSSTGSANRQQGLYQSPNDKRVSITKSDTDSELLMDRADEITDKYRRLSSVKHWWLHPKVKANMKLIVASVVLTVLGVVCIITGIVLEAVPQEEYHGWVFIFAGVICFIPGAYHVFYVICAIRGKKGYSFQRLPAFT